MGEAMNGGGASFPLVAIAVDKDKSSQAALKWTLDNLISKGQTLILVHVNTKPSLGEEEAKEILVPFRCFAKRRDIDCFDVILVDTEIAKAIAEFVAQFGIEKLVVGASRGGFVRSFRYTDVASSVSKSLPDFCTAYIINKGKVSTVRNAVRPAPALSPLRAQIQNKANHAAAAAAQDEQNLYARRGDASFETQSMYSETDSINSSFTSRASILKLRTSNADNMFGSDISFVSSGRPGTDYGFFHRTSNVSDGFDRSFESFQSPRRSLGAYSAATGYSSSVSRDSFSNEATEYVEAELNRLRLELKQTTDMYTLACKEALAAKQKAMELQLWKMEENQRLQQARQAEEAALALAKIEKAKCRAAMEAAEASKRIAVFEAQKRMDAENKAWKSEERNVASNFGSSAELRYRRYKIEEIEEATDYFEEKRKIGEGGYGPVFRCHLDHTPVAVKVLRSDATQGRSQFHQEVEILSSIRHPNMVLLLGACPEFGCLVYEYMENGSLEDRLFRRGNTPSIPWSDRFRIAAEIATALHFLHQTKPEPLVHRDLKPANILLDKNYVSKISDVGLARLVPPAMADQMTQYRMTSAAGTFCYIDPEYQQTGMLGTKSDIYSLGVLLLQLITARPPMGLTHQLERSLEKGTFAEMLDPAVKDWPVEEASSLAKLALKCTELRRKDRPDIGTVILPELNRLRSIGEKAKYQFKPGNNFCLSPAFTQLSVQEMKSGPLKQQLSGYEISSQYSGSSSTGR